MPSSLIKVAPTGQTLMQGGFSQCIHGRGTYCVLTFGYSPVSSVGLTGMGKTSFQRTARPLLASLGLTAGVLFSNRHAMLHPWQAIHLSRSMTIDQRDISLLRVSRGKCRAAWRVSLDTRHTALDFTLDIPSLLCL